MIGVKEGMEGEGMREGVESFSPFFLHSYFQVLVNRYNKNIPAHCDPLPV